MTTPTNKTDNIFFNKVKDFLEHRAQINISDSVTQEKLKIQLIKNVTMMGFVLVSSIFIFYAVTDPQVLTKRALFYIFIILVPLLFGTYFTSTMFETGDKTSLMKFIYMALGLIVFSVLGYQYAKASKSKLFFMNSIMSILVGIMIIVGLAIFYYIFSNYLKKQSGGLGFFINLIFYIPCLFSDFITYAKKEIGLTPNNVFIMFILEILLILLYLFIPKLIGKIVQNNKYLIMNEPIFLNQQETIAQSDLFIVKEDPTGKKIELEHTTENDNDPIPVNTYRDSNYSISFWVYVNTNGASASSYVEEKTIFDYAGGRPKLIYLSNGNTISDKFRVYFTNATGKKPEERSYDITAPTQKWNNFVFNYHDGVADLFINGSLERTFEFKEGLMPKPGALTDNIKVGDENGINGAICNVCYFPYVLNSFEISRTYNLLRKKNPPVFIK